MLAIGGIAALMAGRNSEARAPFTDDIDAGLPHKIGPWVLGPAGQTILPPENDFSFQIYDQVTARRYTAPGQPSVTMVIAYGAAQSYAAQLHRPEWCYPASNFTITELTDITLPIQRFLLPANYMKARRGERQDSVLYWTRVGKSYPQSIWAQRKEIATSAFSRDQQDGIIVRLSIEKSLDGGEKRQLTKFAETLYGALRQEYRQLLFGELVPNGAKVL